MNRIEELSNLERAKNINVLDVKNNKLVTLPSSIFVLQSLKVLDLSCNDIQSLPPELGLMKNLNKIEIQGNPLRSIRMGIRQAGTEALKKYLASRITEEQQQQTLDQIQQQISLQAQKKTPGG